MRATHIRTLSLIEFSQKRSRPSNSIRICSWNIRGLSEEKIHHDILGELLKDIDILALQETWLYENRVIDIEGYKAFHVIRPDPDKNAQHGSGGISVFIKNCLQNRVSLLKSYMDNIVWFKIDTNDSDKPIALCVIYLYHEHSSGNINRDDYFQLLEQDISLYKNQYSICLTGDFNARTGNINDFCQDVEGSDAPGVDTNDFIDSDYFPQIFCEKRVSNDKGVNTYGKNLIDICKSTGIRIANGRFSDISSKYTFIGSNGKSVIDYVIVDDINAMSISSCEVCNKLPESDHCPVLFSLKYNTSSCISDHNSQSRKIYKYKWNKEDLSKLQHTLGNETCTKLQQKMMSQIQLLEDVNIVTDSWYDYFTCAVESIFPKKLCKKMKTNKAPWIDQECVDVRRSLLRQENVNCTNTVKTYKALIQRKKRAFKSELLTTLEDCCNKNPTQFWKTIQSLNHDKQDVCVEPNLVCDKLRELSVIPEMDYFDKSFEQEIQQFIDIYAQCDFDSCIRNKEMCDVLNSNIEVEEITQAIHKIKTGKSPGIDQIPIEFIKATIDAIKFDLKLLFDYILKSEIYPDSWGEGLRVTIPKGDNDIRPITIEPIFAKILETVLDNRITFVNEAFNINDKYNGGFVKGSQTQDNLLILTSCIQKQVCLGKKLYVGFVDFKKAFNYVNHSVLFYKLLKLGMSGHFVNLLRNMYSKIKGIVKINHKLYQTIHDSCGTNQGGPLSPNMFRYMLADLKNFLHTYCGVVLDDEILIHLLWADDLVFMSDSPEGLQKQFDGLFTFCSKFQMIVNELKTKVMIFGNSKQSHVFTFNGKELDVVHEYKYLGVIINSVKDARGNLYKHMMSYISDKARKCSFSVARKCAAVGIPSPKISFQLYDTFTSSVLNYASEIWSTSKETPCIERVQLRFLKQLLGVKDSTCSVAIYGETGRFPVYVKQRCSLIKYWYRIVTKNDSTLVKKAYLMLRQLDSLGFTTWVSKIRELLYLYNFNQYWNCEDLLIIYKEFPEV